MIDRVATENIDKLLYCERVFISFPDYYDGGLCILNGGAICRGGVLNGDTVTKYG